MARIPAPIPRALHVSFPADEVERMNTLLKLSAVPDDGPFPGASWDYGIDLACLKALKRQWEDEFAYNDLEAKLNEFPNYMVKFDDLGIDLHFIHARSSNEAAIPLLLLHGWPGLPHDFHKVIDKLTRPATASSPAFHVVVPSMPGYFLSTYPNRAEWTFADTARLFNRLMVDVLGYDRYFGQGGDWGSFVLRALISLPETSNCVPLAHFNMYFAFPTGVMGYIAALQQLAPKVLGFIPGWNAISSFAGEKIQALTLTPGEIFAIKRTMNYSRNGLGYTNIQGTKPLTVGYAMNASPLALLAYIGEKFYAWSDTSSPDFDTKDLIHTVAVYYLSGCFHTSVLLYNTARLLATDYVLRPDRHRGSKDTLVGYTLFPYEVGAPPRAIIKQSVNLVSYNEKSRGGHFAALDNPLDFVSELRDLAEAHWTA